MKIENLLWFYPSLPVLSPSQWQIVSFPSFFIFPYGQNTAAIKIKTVKFQSWLKLGILVHMKKIFVSLWENDKVKIDSLALLTLTLTLAAGIGFLRDLKHNLRENNGVTCKCDLCLSPYRMSCVKIFINKTWSIPFFLGKDVTLLLRIVFLQSRCCPFLLRQSEIVEGKEASDCQWAGLISASSSFLARHGQSPYTSRLWVTCALKDLSKI